MSKLDAFLDELVKVESSETFAGRTVVGRCGKSQKLQTCCSASIFKVIDP
jgi:hypothetical protein